MSANMSYNLVKIGEDQFVFYSSSTRLESPMDDIFTVSMMVLAWFLLIVGLSFVFCNFCGRHGCLLAKCSCCGMQGVRSEQGDLDSDSITTVGTVRGKRAKLL